MAGFLAKNPADSAKGTEEKGEAFFSTLAELSMDQVLESFAPAGCPSSSTANGIVLKEDMNAQFSAGPLLHPESQVLDHRLAQFNGGAPIPAIPAELEKNLSLQATDMPLPPLVDSVTDNMFKVSISQALRNAGEYLHQHSIENNGNSNTEVHELSSVIPAADEGDALSKRSDEPLSSNENAAIGQTDAPCVQMNDCKMGVDSRKGCKPCCSLTNDGSELGKDKDDGKGDDMNDNADDEEAEDDEEEVDESSSEAEEDSDSSSSTSSLSFTSSSDDEDEVAKLHLLLNGAKNQKDVVMEVESECEEGELKESPSQRKKAIVKKKMTNESSDDEEGFKEPVQSKKKEKGLPYVPKVSVMLEPHHTTVPVGFVSSVVGVSLIVEGIEGQQPLNDGSILWLTDQRQPLGIVDELFGPVKKPFYVVRYNDTSEMPEAAKEGAQVSYVRDFADFVLNNPDLYVKGYDECADEDFSDSEVYFSDDEKEAEYKRAKSSTKRGNPEASTFEFDNRGRPEKRAEGKRFNKDNKNRKGRGDSGRTHEFFGRPPRHQNGRFEHDRCEREQPFGNYVEPMQTSNHGNTHWRRSRSPVRQTQALQTRGMNQSKSSTPESSTSDSTHQQVQRPKLNQLQNTSSPISQETMLMNQLCNSSQPNQTDRMRTSEQAEALEMNRSQSFPQLASQQVQPLVMNQPQNSMKSSSQQQIQMNQPFGPMQATLTQVQLPWQQSNQQQMTASELSGIQHAQVPAYNNNPIEAGRIPHASTSGYCISLGNKLSLQPGPETVQGLLSPTYQSPMYQQQVLPLNQFSTPMLQHLPGQGSQVAPNMGIPIGNHMQGVHASGYAVGVQPAALGTPVLGIPASTPFNYSSQMVSNQNFLGVTLGGTLSYPSQTQLASYGTPEMARILPPMAGSPSASWQQQQHQQHLPQDSSGPMPQQSLQGPRSQQRRPHFADQRRGPYQGRRS